MEELPFKIMVGLLVAAIVLALGIQAVKSYMNIQVRKQFADDISKIKTTMDTLVSMSDKGSFSKVHVRIPDECKIKFTGNKMIVDYFGETKEFDIPGNVVEDREYGPGEYDLVIYYGKPQGEDANRVAFE